MSLSSGNPPRLLDQVREVIRMRHYSIRTEQAYVQWIRRFILFNSKRHPREMGAPELTAFLSDLATQHHVAASTQNQALNAILFLYRDVLKIDLPWLDQVQRAKKPQHLPVVFTREEVKALLAHLHGTTWLMAMLTYGSGLRLLECLRLRVKDVDFSYKQLLVRDAKGQKDRVTMLPNSLIDPIRTHLARVRQLHESDLREGFRPRLPAARAGREVSGSGSRVGLAIRVPVVATLDRSSIWNRTPSPCAGGCVAARREAGNSQGQYRQAG
jgi:integron integrase